MRQGCYHLRMRSLPAIVAAILAAILVTLSGCGAPPRAADPADELDAMRAQLDRAANLRYGPSVHLYAVLTRDPKAMQSEAAVKGMWDAVHGKAPRHAWITRHLAGLPAGYEANITLDFADLPHPVLSAAKLEALLAGLPADVRAQAKAARLAVFVRGDLQALPNGAQVRLAGLAAQHVAEASDGIVIDLLTRRAWTRADWLAEIQADPLGAGQVRLGASKRDDGVWLTTRGNPKFGEPDLLMRGIPADGLAAAKARFATVHAALLARGGGRAGDASDGRIAGAPLLACDLPKGAVDVECARIEP